MASLPELGVHESSTRSGGRRTHGYVWHEDDLSAKKGSSSHILDDVVVVADQDTCFPAMEIKSYIFVSRREMGADERMKFSIFCEDAGVVNADIGVVDVVIRVSLKQAGEDGGFSRAGD